MRNIKHERSFLQEGAININNLPFSKHNDQGKSHAMMVSLCEIQVEVDEKKASEDKPNLDQMAQQEALTLFERHYMGGRGSRRMQWFYTSIQANLPNTIDDLFTS